MFKKNLVVSEVLVISLLLIFSAQNSSLWSSLILVPMSGLTFYSLMSMQVSSSAFLFMYIMVFIGGLLVLLVSVASITFQEQGYNFSIISMMIVFLLMAPLLIEFKSWMNTTSLIPMSMWFEAQGHLVTLIILVLVVALFTISSSLLTFKGFIRGL